MNRRSFLASGFATIAGSSLLDAKARASLLQGNDIAESSQDDSYWQMISSQFEFEPGLTYFNNGSLGPSPRIVRDATETFRRQLDLFPSKYMWTDWWDDRERVRQTAAGFLGASPDEIALTHNTCEGLNLVASSLQFQPGDEIIASPHEHHTGVVPLQHFQESRGVQLVRPQLPLLPTSSQELLDVFTAAITPKTRAILVCHIVNTNGMIMPVKELCEIARQKNIRVIVDGAQAVGMIPVNVAELGCDFYAASGHKWVFGPKGTGLFYVRKDRMDELSPLIVSKAYYHQNNARKFENYNTRNVPEVLGLGVALDYLSMVGLQNLYERVLSLKSYLRKRVEASRLLSLETPEDDSLSAGITNVSVSGKEAHAVANVLDTEYAINCRPMQILGLNSLRVSTAVYNRFEQVDQLIDVLENIAKKR
jgi:isopenicillin-N epimerase